VPEGHDLTINQLTINIGDTLVRIDPAYFRPTEVDLLLGDPSKAKTQLGWEAEYDVKGLVADMMKGDLKAHPRS
jgi:GDPmannose 4,6-dehydratase